MSASNNDSVDFVDVFAVVLYLGLGLTSLSLALWPISPTRYDHDLAGLMASATADGKTPPGELLIAGAQLEDLVIEPIPDDVDGLDASKVRLVSQEDPPSLLRDRYWVVRQAEEDLKPPVGYEETTLEEGDNVTLVEWVSSDASRDVQLTDRIRGATAAYVPMGDKGETVRCERWLFGRLFCGPNAWNWVGEREVTINGQQEHCIWAHPRTGYELQVTFPGFRFDGVMRGRYALADQATQQAGGSPVTFRVEVDGKERVKRVLPNRKGWNVFTLRPGKDDAERVDLSFIVSAPNDAQRHFCFDATISASGGPRGVKR